MTLPVDISRLHAQAIVDMLNTGLAPLQVDDAYQVYLGEVSTREEDIVWPYLVVWPSPAHRPTNLQAGYDGAATTLTQITAAGVTAEETIAALDRAVGLLNRQRPTIVGRRCAPLRHEPGGTPPQPQRDDRVHTPLGRPAFFSFVLFHLYSTPAGGTTP